MLNTGFITRRRPPRNKEVAYADYIHQPFVDARARERGWDGQRWADKANTRRDARFREALQRLALRREEREARQGRAEAAIDYRKGRVHLRDLLLVEVPPIPWRVVDFIGSGLTVFMGLPKVGKSYLLLQLAEAVGSGKPFMGWETRQGRVLYFAIEDGPDITVRRMQVMGLNRRPTWRSSGKAAPRRRRRRPGSPRCWRATRRSTSSPSTPSGS